MKVLKKEDPRERIVSEATSCFHQLKSIDHPDLTNHCECECGWQSGAYYDNHQAAFDNWLAHIASLHQAGVLNIPLVEKYVYSPQHLALILSGQMSVVASAGERWKQKHAE